MRFKLNKKPHDGDSKTERVFLLFPTKLPNPGGVDEIRWLEWSYIDYMYVTNVVSFWPDGWWYKWNWHSGSITPKLSK